MIEQPSPEQGIQAEQPASAASSTSIQESPSIPDSIPLPPLPAISEPTPPLAVGWSKFDVFLLLLLATLAFFLGSYSANNSDFWMHLATGRDLVNGSHQLGVDPYSFATVRDGAPVRWVNHSWLYDIGLYAIYQAAGGQGVVIVHALLNVLLVLTLIKFCAPESSRPAVLLMAGLILLVASTRMPLNSILVSYLLLSVMLALLRRGGALAELPDGDKPSSVALFALPVMFALWVNLDDWFILGLVALMLIVAGNAVSCFLGRRRDGALWRQGVVVVACVVACQANPFHIHAFTLPPELAYALGDWLPSSLGAGGETLRSLAKYDPDSFAGSSFGTALQAPFNPFRAQVPFTADRVAYFVLAPLALLSAPMVIFASTSPNGPPLPLGRLLLLGTMTILGYLQVRMIPLFAVLAGPLTMLNFNDFAQWLRRRPNRDPHGGFNPALARLATAVVLLVCLALAWPGWLHSRFFVASSQRRVAWEVFEDPSLRAAAEAVKAPAQRVFNYSPELANYCAWFAPEVRCYLDQRHALFAHEAARYGTAKRGLRDDAIVALDEVGKSPRGEWREVFRAHKIDYLALSRFSYDFAPTTIASLCWLDRKHWTLEFADGYCLVSRWSPDGGGDRMALTHAFNREAFGAVPEARRAPQEGSKPMSDVQSLQSLYLEGSSPLARRASGLALMYEQYFQLMRRRLSMMYEPAWLAGIWCIPTGLGGAAPGSVLWSSACRLSVSGFRSKTDAPEFGPPAIPLLMIRQARRAVHEQPQDAFSYRTLYSAIRLQYEEVEIPWSDSGGAKTDRGFIRHVQLASALRNYLDLQPDDWKLRMEFAKVLYQERLLDAGLDQLAQALKSLEKSRRDVRDPRTLEAFKAEEKKAVDFYKFVERDVRRRRNDFDIQSSKRKPLEKFSLAVLERYKSVNQMNQDVYESTGMGLPLEGLKQLDAVPPGSLGAREQRAADYHRVRLHLLLGQLGEANIAAAALAPGPDADQLIMWYAAAVGDYELADKLLGRMEAGREARFSADQARSKFAASAAGRFALMNVAGDLPAAARAFLVNFSDMPIRLTLNEYQESIQDASTRTAWRTVRGLLALEAGDTARAAQHFAEAKKHARPEFQFTDQRIVDRYLTLLRQQRK